MASLLEEAWRQLVWSEALNGTNRQMRDNSLGILHSASPLTFPNSESPHILPQPVCTLSGLQAARHLCPHPHPRSSPSFFCAVQGWGPLTFWYRQDNLAEGPTAQFILSKDTELVLNMGLQPWH